MACAVSTVPSNSWFCHFCCEDAMVPNSNAQRDTRRNWAQRRHLDSSNEQEWARIWQSVRDQTSIDLDFPFDDVNDTRPSAAQRRDFQVWQQRFNIADQQGSAARFRQNAASILDSRRGSNRALVPPGESQDELRAWNAFDKAIQLQDAENSSGERNKRRTLSSSPATENQTSEAPRRFKRPRTRRVQGGSEVAEDGRDENSDPVAGPTAAANTSSIGRRADMHGNRPSFLQSLLKEVEKGSENVETSGQQNRGRSQYRVNPQPGSNVSSPRSLSPTTPGSTSSGQLSPRLHPVSPTSSQPSRSASPPPLTSRVEPKYAEPAFYSPVPSNPKSPAHDSAGIGDHEVHR